MGAFQKLIHTPTKMGRALQDWAMIPATGSPQRVQPRIRRLEDRVLLSATPEAAVVDLPAQELINEAFQFAVSFDNTALSNDPQGTGYGPFVDVTVGPGIDVQSVTYLGTPVTAQAIATWDGTNWVDASGAVVSTHPLDGSLAMPDGTEVGQTWIEVLVPFGSYTPDQPSVRLDFTATLDESLDPTEPGAVVGTPIDVTARGGFQFGLDPLQNPTTDPPVQQGATSTDTVTPVVMRLDKAVQLPESETAQGPNFPFTYTISIDVADGAVVTDLDIPDLLPSNLFFLSATTNIAADSVIAPGVGGTPVGVPGLDTITEAHWTFGTVIGRAGGGDIVITLTAYAPEQDATSTDIIDPANPQPAIASNDATVTGDYRGVPVDSTTGGALEDSVDIIIRPFTVLKSVSVEGGGEPIPGAYLRYEIDIDVSDYQAFQNAIITDQLSDGLTFDTTDNLLIDHTPVLGVRMNGQIIVIRLNPNDITELTAAFQGDNSEALTFFISNVLANHQYDSQLVGDLFNNDGQQGPTEATLVYYARIDENFREPGRGAVVVNDVLTNAVAMGAGSAVSGNPSAPDDSGTSTGIPAPEPAKTVYAVNGVVGAPANISPGDLVTYRLRIELSTSDLDNLVITDFLPLPVYDVDANGTGFIFINTQGGTPAPFVIIRGPDDTLTGGIAGTPLVVTNGALNNIQLSYPNFNEDGSRGGVVDLLYTVQATDQPFADGLLLVNQAVVQTGDSNTTLVLEQDMVSSIVLHQPELTLTKGAVATNATGSVDNSLAFSPSQVGPSKLSFAVGTPGFTTSSPLTSADLAASPIESDLRGFDAGDTVKFAIVVENTGGQDAFDVTVRDVLPAGFSIPANALLTVSYGDGTAVSFTGTINDLFSATGIVINDNAGIGSMAPSGDASGHNIIVITYELVVDGDFAPQVTVDNEAELLRFAAIEGGTNFTTGIDGDFTDEVLLTSQGVKLDKALFATDQTFTTGNDLTIGEIGTFQIGVTVPDGQTSAVITDLLPVGMVYIPGTAFLRLVSFDGTVSQGGVALADNSPLIGTQSGQTLTLNFSSIVANAAPGTALAGQRFVIEYQAQATDNPALTAGTTVNNSATLDTPTTAPTPPVSAPVDIVEPSLTVDKEFQPSVAQANETVQMRLSVVNGSGTFNTTSFGLTLTDDDLPVDVFSVVQLATITGTGGVNTSVVNVSVTQAGGFYIINITAPANFAMAPGERLDIVFDLTIASNVVEGTVVDNTATIPAGGYSSLPGTPPVERQFGPESGSDVLEIATPQITKTLINTSYGGTETLLPGDPGYRPDANPNVLVGEVLTYEIRVNIPRGVANDVVVYDDTDFLTEIGAQGTVGIVSVDRITLGAALQFDPTTTFATAITDTNGDGVANRLSIDFGTISNIATSPVPDPDDESIVIILRVQVLNRLETDDGDVQTNGTAVTFTVGETPNFNRPEEDPTITIHEPAIDIVKTATTPDSTTDAGDVVTYKLTLRHNGTSSADGFSLDLTDVLPVGMELIAGSVTIDAGTPAFGLDPLQLGDVTLDTATGQVHASGFDLGLNQVVSITYQARVAANVVSAQVLTNTATLTYKSLPALDPLDSVDPSTAQGVEGAVSQRRDGSDGGPRTDQSILNNYEFQTSANIVIATPGPVVKTADKTTYTIGEEIIYTITIPIIEGVTLDPFVTDVLPAGIVYIDGSGTAVDGNGNPINDIIEAFTVSGSTLTLDLATVQTVADNDESNDFFRLSFRAKVLNVFDNENGDIKTNTVTFTSTGQPPRSASVNVGIVEPDLVQTKVNNAPGPVDAGDTVTFTVTTQHASDSSANAFEYQFRDVIPANLGNVQIVSATINGVDVSGQVIFDGNAIVSAPGANLDIPMGSVFTLVYRVTVLDTVGPNQTLTNLVLGSWTSLDGSTPQSGTPQGERIGTLARDVNDYVDAAINSITTSARLDMTKSIIGPDSNFAVGETVTYALDVRVFEGTLQNVVLTDVSDAGLSIDLNSLTVVGGAFAGATPRIVNPQLTVDAAGRTTLIFGLDNDPASGNQIVNPGDPLGSLLANDTFTITYNAVVTNVFRNQNAVQISNAALITANDVAPAPGAEVLVVVEPNITIDKTVVSPAGSVDAGDVITYQVVLFNNGTSTAYDVTFVDAAPANTLFTGTVSAPVGTFAIAGGGTQILGSGFDLAIGASMTITYTVTVQDTVSPGDVVQNLATTRWTSTPGANPNERTGADGAGPDATVLNNYEASDTTTLGTAFTLGVQKTLDSSNVAQTAGSQLAVGETATFRLRVNISEGTTENVVLTDVLPTGQAFLPGSIQVAFGAAGMSTTLDPRLASILPGTNTLVINLGNVTNPGDGNATNDFLDITYTVVIQNNPTAVVDGAALSNTVTATANLLPDASAQAVVSVVEPDLIVTKDVAAPFVAIGEAASYEIRVEHSASSTVAAFDLVITDPFNDPNILLDPATLVARIDGMPGAPAPLVEVVGNGFRVTAAELSLGATLVINFQAVAQALPAANGADALNTTSIAYDSIPGTGTPDEQRHYAGQDDAVVTIAGPDLQVVKDASLTIVAPGQAFTYAIQVLNKGAPGVDAGAIEQARAVVLTDTLPQDISLLGVTVDGVPVPFSVDPVTRQFSISLGTLNPDQTVEVVLTVQLADVLSPVPDGGTLPLVLVNTASAFPEQPDPTPDDNTDDAPVIPLDDGRPPAPDLVVTKTNAVEEIGGSETVAFTITAQNVGSRVAASVLVIDRIDTGVFEFVSASDGGTFDPVSGTVTWQRSTLSPDDGVLTFQMVLRVRPGLNATVDSTTNFVGIRDNGLGGADPTPENNRDQHTDRLIYPDLVVTKSNAVDELSFGDRVDYAITVANVGDFRADGVIVRDFIDQRIFSFVSASNGGVFDPSTGIVTWTLGTVLPGAPPISLTLTLEVLFPPPGIELARNVVEVQSDGTRGLDSNLGNNTDFEEDILNASPDPNEIARALHRGRRELEEFEIEPVLYVSPIFTGRSAAGASVTVTLIAADGSAIDSGSVVASPDGNWNLVMDDVAGGAPVSALIVTAPPPLANLGVLDRTNIFFSPGTNAPIEFYRQFDVYSAEDFASSEVLAAQMAASEDPLAVSSRRYINFNSVRGTSITGY